MGTASTRLLSRVCEGPSHLSGQLHRVSCIPRSCTDDGQCRIWSESPGHCTNKLCGCVLDSSIMFASMSFSQQLHSRRPPVAMTCGRASAALLRTGADLGPNFCFCCTGGMNNKARTDDWRVKLAFPLFVLIEIILKTRFIFQPLFDSFRTPENVRTALENLYCNPDQVDDELVNSVCRPGVKSLSKRYRSASI